MWKFHLKKKIKLVKNDHFLENIEGYFFRVFHGLLLFGRLLLLSFNKSPILGGEGVAGHVLCSLSLDILILKLPVYSKYQPLSLPSILLDTQHFVTHSLVQCLILWTSLFSVAAAMSCLLLELSVTASPCWWCTPGSTQRQRASSMATWVLLQWLTFCS